MFEIKFKGRIENIGCVVLISLVGIAFRCGGLLSVGVGKGVCNLRGGCVDVYTFMALSGGVSEW